MSVEKLYPLAVIEAQYIIKVLKHYNWNRTNTAISLDISLRTLRNKIHYFRSIGLEIPDNHTLDLKDLGSNTNLGLYIDVLNSTLKENI